MSPIKLPGIHNKYFGTYIFFINLLFPQYVIRWCLCVEGRIVKMSLKERLATSKKIFAIELSTNKEVKDLELLRAIEPTFISVTWHGSPCDSHTDYEQIPPIALAKQMQLLNYEVLVHFPGRYLTEDQATKVLVTLKKNHVKNLFIVQGGHIS